MRKLKQILTKLNPGKARKNNEKAIYVTVNGYVHVAGVDIEGGLITVRTPAPESLEPGKFYDQTLLKRGALMPQSDKPKNFFDAFDEFHEASEMQDRTPLGGLDIDTILTAGAFISKDQNRPAMCGVYVGADIVGTDATKMYYAPNPAVPERPYIIPGKVIELLKLYRRDKWVAYGAGSYLVFECDALDMVITFDFVTGERYPHYNAVIPEPSPNTIKIDRAAVAQAVKHVLPYAEQTNNTIVFDFDAGTVSAQDTDIGTSCVVDLPKLHAYTGDLIRIGFNGKFLLDVIKHLPKGPTLEIELTEPNRAAVLNGCALLMPVLIKE